MPTASIPCAIVSKVSLCSLSATHLLQQGTDIYEIKRLLGHTSIKTTWRYIRLTTDWRENIKSPIDMLSEVR